MTTLDSGEGVRRESTSTGEFTRVRREEYFSGFEGLEVASRRVDDSGRPCYAIIFAGKPELRTDRERLYRVGVDLFRTLTNGRQPTCAANVPEEHCLELKRLQEECDIQFLVLTFLGSGEARDTAAETTVDEIARTHGLDLRLVKVDQHSGLPFGRPGLRESRPNWSEDQVERHQFSTGGKDWVCFRESIGVLLDDSEKNLGPARDVGVECYRVDNQREDTCLVRQLRRFEEKFRRDPDYYSTSRVRARLSRPVEAPDEEKQHHQVDRRKCFFCGQSGHLARDCTSGGGRSRRALSERPLSLRPAYHHR